MIEFLTRNNNIYGKEKRENFVEDNSKYISYAIRIVIEN